MYLLLCGCLPFDDEHSEREIARYFILRIIENNIFFLINTYLKRQTIHDPVPYPSSIWKKISIEAKTLVDSKILFY